MIELPLVTEHLNFPQTAAERTVNFYAEKVGKNFILRCTPGLSLFGTLPGTGGMRGLLSVVGPVNRLFGVRGNRFCEWDGTEWVERGLLDSSVGVVGMAYNDTQCIVVDDTKGYGYTFANTASFAEISPFQGGMSQVVYSQLRMVTLQPGSDFFWVSRQDSVFDWDALAGARTESKPDPNVALAVVGQVLYVFGSESYEVWTTSPNFEFPFARANLVGNNIGVSARNSVVTFGGSVFFLGGNSEGRGIVYRMDGYNPTPISDERISQIIQAMPSFDDAVGFCYQEQGHVFYQLSFGAGNKTLTYDNTTGLWAEREYRNPVSGEVSRRPEIVQCVYNGKMLVGDWRNGNVYEMSREYFTDGVYPVTTSTASISGLGSQYVEVDDFNLNNVNARFFNINYYIDTNRWIILVYASAEDRTNFTNLLGWADGDAGEPTQLVVCKNDSGAVQASFYLKTVEIPELPVNFDVDYTTVTRDVGVPVVREKVLTAWPEEQVARAKVPPFALFLDMGNTLVGEDAPKVMLSWSDNRGRTYSNEHYREMGRQGEYGKRIVWRGQGTTYGRNYKFSLTGNQDFVVRRAALLDEQMA